MNIYYKNPKIDYEKTLGKLDVGEEVVISTADNDLATIRMAVIRVGRRFPTQRSFKVQKSADGAVITRVS